MEISSLYSSPKYFPMASLFTQNENQSLYNRPVPTQSGFLSPLRPHLQLFSPSLTRHSLNMLSIRPVLDFCTLLFPLLECSFPDIHMLSSLLPWGLHLQSGKLSRREKDISGSNSFHSILLILVPPFHLQCPELWEIWNIGWVGSQFSRLLFQN